MSDRARNGIATSPRRWVTLYDFGGSALLFYIIGGVGLAAGAVFDYGWNYLVLSVTLYRLRVVTGDIGQALAKYCLVVTAIGLLLDAAFLAAWIYIGFMRLDVDSLRQAMAIGVGLFVPTAALIGWVNAALAQWRLGLSRRHARILGVAMGVATAPWAILIGLSGILSINDAPGW